MPQREGRSQRKPLLRFPVFPVAFAAAALSGPHSLRGKSLTNTTFMIYPQFKMHQLELIRKHGGARKGAGRKRGRKVSHRQRPKLRRQHPVHAILRTGITNLRSGPAFGIVKRCLVQSCSKPGFRIVHFSVQSNHVHLIVEADGEVSLARGMQGLAIRIAKNLNFAFARQGRVFEDHYFAEQVKSPAQTRHTLRYVLRNIEHHTGRRLSASDSRASENAPLVAPQTWLLRVGWRVSRGKVRPPGEAAAASTALTVRAASPRRHKCR